jgi:hypothetical protein
LGHLHSIELIVEGFATNTQTRKASGSATTPYSVLFQSFSVFFQNLEKKTKEVTKEKEELKKHNSSLREKLRVLRNEIKILLDTSTKNGLIIILPELPAPAQTEAANNVAPVSVATQTMPLVKKVEAVQGSEDEEINVDEVTES